MSNDFIEMINDIDFLYGFIYEHADLVNNLQDNYNYDLAIELYYNFVLPIINITKDQHIKEYNEHVENMKHIKNNCSYLMDICFERYFELSRNEYSKKKKIIDNNIDTFESILSPTNSFDKLYRYYSFDFPVLGRAHNFVNINCHCTKNYGKCVCIIERNNYGLKNIAKSYFNIYYIKFFYLLQKVTKLNISNINRRILEKIFINLYNNSNINCNEKVENKINDLYREIIIAVKFIT